MMDKAARRQRLNHAQASSSAYDALASHSLWAGGVYEVGR